MQKNQKFLLKNQQANSKEYYVAIREAAYYLAEIETNCTENRCIAYFPNINTYKYITKVMEKGVERFYFPLSNAEDDQYFKKIFIVLLTGICAEARIRGIKDYMKCSAAKELNEMIKITFNRYLDENISQAYVKYIEAESMSILHQYNWDFIIFIANELIEYKTINRERMELLTDKWANGETDYDKIPLIQYSSL